MIIIVNPNANFGKGLKRWRIVEKEIMARFSNAKVVFSKSISHVEEIVNQNITQETVFISSGGDGSINTLLNAIVSNCKKEEDLKKYTIGAIGLGSSNDFHKPFTNTKCINKIHCKVNPKMVIDSDIGRIDYSNQVGQRCRKYFLINASLGVTAAANHFYNHPDGTLSMLKRMSVDLAILYAAIKTIFCYKNQFGTIIVAGKKTEIVLSNIGVQIKSFFSGSFYYDTKETRNDGMFRIYLSQNMNGFELLKVLIALVNGKFSGSKTSAWSDQNFNINLKEFYSIEVDGETFKAKNMNFTLIPKAIKLCL